MSAFEVGSFHSPRIARLFLEAGADTASDVRFEDIDGRVLHDASLVVATLALRVWETNEEILHDVVDGLKGVIRLLKQVEAVHAVS